MTKIGFSKILTIVGLILGLISVQTMSAQADSFVLTGNYLMVGIGSGGTLIDDEFNVGLQFDPSGSGSFPQSDFIKPGGPGVPFQFYSLGINEDWVEASFINNPNPFNLITKDISYNGTYAAISYGIYGFHGLFLINHVLSFDFNDTVIKNTFQIFNMGNQPLVNIAFATGLDPDQDVDMFGIRDTINGISGNVVWAIGPKSGLTIQMVSLTPGGVPTVDKNWIRDPYWLNIPHNDGNGDWTIALAWKIGSLDPGRSITFDWEYRLSLVPLPASVLLLGSGLLGLGAVGWRRRRNKEFQVT